jgi:hypothetical protein
MKRRIGASILVLVLAYTISYVWFRQTHIEVWSRDGNPYLIFPQDKAYLYYVYRPLSYIDGTLTGMKFHIGPHR